MTDRQKCYEDRVNKLTREDGKENSEKRQSLLMWLGYTMKLPREDSLLIVEHISEFYIDNQKAVKE